MGHSPLSPKIEIESSAKDVSSDTHYRNSSISKKTLSFVHPVKKTVSDIARTRVHKLIILWIQLILTNIVNFAIVNRGFGLIIGIISLSLIVPLSFFISKLVSRNFVTSIMLGSLIIALLEGGIAYAMFGEYAIKDGLLFGAFYGASLSGFFSAYDKHTNLFWAAFSTLALTIGLCARAYYSYGIISYIETIRDFIGESIQGAVITIVIGLLMIYPIIQIIQTVEYRKDSLLSNRRRRPKPKESIRAKNDL